MMKVLLVYLMDLAVLLVLSIIPPLLLLVVTDLDTVLILMESAVRILARLTLIVVILLSSIQMVC